MTGNEEGWLVLAVAVTFEGVKNDEFTLMPYAKLI